MRDGRIKHAAAVVAMLSAGPILFLMLVGGLASQSEHVCAAGGTVVPAAVPDGGFDVEHLAVAQQIVAAVRAFPKTADKPHASVIALATARQESGIRNLDYGDLDSLGAFQQRPSQGWGTPAEVMDVAHATTTFLQRLVRVPGWETRRVTDVAADVQRPAEEYRDLYEQWVPLAIRLTEKLWPGADVSLVTAGAGPSCDQVLLASGSGEVVYPVHGDFRWSDNRNWGDAGSRWDNWHTGTDFSAPCGTPVLAATSGTVEIMSGESWAGRWLVKVVTGPESVATWYAHMQQLDVRAGDQVLAGQQIGEVGNLGNATGCHLHFEVHLQNGSIYGPDNTDPSRWLTDAVANPRGSLR
jgi:murein DD-endopeptidase MepM/ murein hydrolase activator NlpD